MIIDEKHMYPSPPDYYRPPPPPFTPASPKQKPNLGALPSHILLQIVYQTFPQQDGRYEGEGKVERQRATLHWLVTALRLVNRALYTACMHVLRSTYLPAYDSLIRHPYSSDPFPSDATDPTNETIFSTHRELATLDAFIALLAHEDLMLDATVLHLPREEAYKDLFDMMQPRSRLEDLVREEGVAKGIIYDGTMPAPHPTNNDELEDKDASSSLIEPEAPSPSRPSFNLFSKSSIKATLTRSRKSASTSSPAPPSPSIPHVSPPQHRKAPITPVPFGAISVAFTPRRVGLVYTTGVGANASNSFGGSTYGALSMSVAGPTGPGGRRKTIVEVSRERRDESLEVCARELVGALQNWLEEETGRDHL